jgi:hypothetical protein
MTDFEKSQDLWIEGQKLLIQELELKKEFMIKNIEIQNTILINTDETLQHELKQLNDYLNSKLI